MRTDRAIKFIVVFVIVFVAGWLVWHQWIAPDGTPRVDLPSLPGSGDARLFCAVSDETGRCSCITPAGIRPDVPQEECRQRARESDTR